MTCKTENSRTVLGRRPARLRLKLRQTGKADRVLDVALSKFSVGAAADCHLRLPGTGVEPRQCLILHGLQQTVIRNWSPKTRLNGRPFEDSLFSPGDLLHIGNLELEYLPPIAAESCPSGDAPPLTKGNDDHNIRSENSSEQRSAEAEKLLRDLDHEKNRLSLQRRELDAEQKRLKAEQSRLLYERSELQHLLVNCQHQVDVAAAQIAAAENSRFQANPATAEQVSEQVCEQPDKQAGKMAGEQAHEQELRIAAELSALTARSEELSTREGELNRRVAEISERESRLATDSGNVRQKEQNLAEREQQLEQRYLEYDARNRELEQLRAETTSAAEELAKDRAAENTTPASEQTTLAEPVRSASPTATETSIEKSTAKPAEEPSPQAEQPAGSNSGPMPQPTTDVAPKSAPDQDEDAIFARLRRLSLLKSDSGTKSDESNSEPLDPPDAIEELEESPPEPSVEQPPMENEKPLSSAHCDEDSVEAYMARLLTRLRNNGSSTPAPAPATNNTSFRRATEMVAERDQEAAVRQTIVEPLDKKVAEEEKKDAEWTLQPRSQAPELTSDLKAMRELANMNTQVALDKHVQKRWSSAAIGKAGVAGVAVASGIYLMITANSLEDMEFLSGATAMIVAIFWGLQSLILTKQVQDVRKKKPEARFDHHLGRSKMIPGETKSGDMVMDLDTADDSDDDETNQG